MLILLLTSSRTVFPIHRAADQYGSVEQFLRSRTRHIYTTCLVNRGDRTLHPSENMHSIKFAWRFDVFMLSFLGRSNIAKR